jgi:hypothetical protein
MSDAITTTSANPFDAAIDACRERERDLDIQAQALIIRRDEVREMIALLNSRRPRAPRKPRAVTEVADQVSAPPVESPFRFVPAIVEAAEGVAS